MSLRRKNAGRGETTGSILREGDQAERGMCESVNCHRRTHMASPLVIFAAGMGTAALSLGLGYATLYVPDGSQPSKTQIILANRPEPPPPTVEKVKREPRPVVAAMEPPAAPTVHVTRDHRDGEWLAKRSSPNCGDAESSCGTDRSPRRAGSCPSCTATWRSPAGCFCARTARDC